LVGPLVGPCIRWLVCPHITSKTGYVAFASRRGEGRGNQLMLKTGYVEIASRLVTVHPFLFICNKILIAPHDTAAALLCCSNSCHCCSYNCSIYCKSVSHYVIIYITVKTISIFENTYEKISLSYSCSCCCNYSCSNYCELVSDYQYVKMI
jgi:hypothetical protein